MKKNSTFQYASKIKLFVFLVSIVSINVACSDDDKNPVAVDEEEVITTMNVTLTAASQPTIDLQSQDLDGDGPNSPEITVSGNLIANTTYTGTIELLNETESPADNITTEVAEEDEEHQFFFSTSGSLTDVSYSDQDGNGNPVGINFTLNTGDAGNGSLQITLRHEPKKPNDGSLTDAGGETDIAQIFAITVE